MFEGIFYFKLLFLVQAHHRHHRIRLHVLIDAIFSNKPSGAIMFILTFRTIPFCYSRISAQYLFQVLSG
ncbi:hypothetical protein HQN84_23440 [Pedobacter steynii]|uniref:hypothetical protein n=1 Tax=Pedobacter steynii TaxID=430522 RepID=UPI00115F829D|nr:hypothetical protein [Pedobacter steynii]NQX41824.1 hypothetical protein [Pedobacter steynii]